MYKKKFYFPIILKCTSQQYCVKLSSRMNRFSSLGLESTIETQDIANRQNTMVLKTYQHTNCLKIISIMNLLLLLTQCSIRMIQWDSFEKIKSTGKLSKPTLVSTLNLFHKLLLVIGDVVYLTETWPWNLWSNG